MQGSIELPLEKIIVSTLLIAGGLALGADSWSFWAFFLLILGALFSVVWVYSYIILMQMLKKSAEKADDDG